MKYMKITKEIRGKNEIPKRKTTPLSVLLFFQQIKTYCETLLRKSLLTSGQNFAYNSYERLLRKKVLIYKAISGTDKAYCGSKL